MAGIVCGGIVGGPAITLLIRRLRLQPGKEQATTVPAAVAEELDIAVGDGVVVDTEAAREFNALKSIVVILLAMWVGAWVGQGFDALGLTLPVYIGAMLVGAVIRNFDDRTGWVGLSVQTTRSEEHTSELQSLLRISSAVFCLKKTK